jgi:hypothetical protein
MIARIKYVSESASALYQIVLTVCILTLTSRTSFAQNQDPRKSDEYTEFVEIVDAYRQHHPATVGMLQTEKGTKLCDRLYVIPAIADLPMPQPIRFNETTQYTWYLSKVYKSELSFAFIATNHSPVEGIRFSVMFSREDIKKTWQLDDISVLDSNTDGGSKFISQMTSTDLINLITWDSQISAVAKAAKAVKDVLPNDYDNMRLEITGFQGTASKYGLGERKEVLDFVAASNDMLTLAMQWPQIIKQSSSQSVSSQSSTSKRVNIQAQENTQVDADAMNPRVKAEETVGLSAQYGDAHDSTNDFKLNYEQIIKELSPVQAEEYKKDQNALDVAYRSILQMAQN